jgi:hypothetical protein
MSDGLYRSPYPEPRENDEVCISREEYAHLRRAAEILDHVEDGADVDYYSGRTRYRWAVSALGEYTDYGRATEEEGRGRTFREAAEIAFGLPPIEPWHEHEVVPRRPWKRFVLLGAVVTLAVQWAYPMLLGALQ